MENQLSKEFIEALSKMQSEFKTVEFNAENPHLKSKYATHSANMEMVRPLLAKYGFFLTQDVYTEADKDNYVVKTKLYHTSGGCLDSGPMVLKLDKLTMQSLGSAISYAKRYQMCAILGIVSDKEDDDAHTSAPLKTKSVQMREPVKPAPDYSWNPDEEIDPPQEATTKPKFDKPSHSHVKTKMVTEPQLKRLFAIQKARTEEGWTQDTLKTFVQDGYGIQTRKDIPMNAYNEIIDFVQNKTFEQAYKQVMKQ